MTIKPSKYRNSRTVFRGVSYASKAEALRASQLSLLEASGDVDVWTPHPRYTLGIPENVYVADFFVVEHGEARVEDVKGAETPRFRWIKRLWKEYGEYPLHILKRKRDRWVTEIIIPKRKESTND